MTVMIPTTILAMLASAVGPAGSEPDVRQVVLEVDGRKLLDEQIAASAENTLYFVRSDSTKALGEAHGVKVVEDAQGVPAILVSLSWVNYSDSIYGVRLEARRPGEEAKLVESFECACVDSELTAAIIARLPAALEQLEGREPQPAAADPTATEGGEPSSDEPAVTASPEPEDRTSAPLGTMGKAGIGLLSGGVVAIVTGGVAFAVGERYESAVGHIRDRDGRDYGPAGVALMVTGGAALLTGVALLAVDRSRARKRASALLLPSPGGLVITGRF